MYGFNFLLTQLAPKNQLFIDGVIFFVGVEGGAILHPLGW